MSEPHDLAHDRVSEIVHLSADQGRVWQQIGGFDRIADWHPLIENVELSTIEGDTYRHLRTVDGERFFERLMETGTHHVTYEIVESPFPVSDCRATLSCVAEETGCRVFWSAFFVPDDGAGHLADEIVAKFFEIGLTGLRDRFG